MSIGRRLAVLLAFTIFVAPAALAQLPPIQTATARQIKQVIKARPSTVTVVNFWATWCIPCREELPVFVRLGREFDPSTVRVLFVSADFPEDLPEARHFLAEHGVSDVSYLRVGDDQEFITAFNEGWSGALPATALYGRGGELAEFWEGKTSYEDLSERVLRVLAQEKADSANEEQTP